MNKTDLAFSALRNALSSYYPLSEETWSAFKAICKYREPQKSEILYLAGEVPATFSFVYSGLFRVFTVDNKGNEYNKNFFDEGKFPGAMTALLKSEPSEFTIEALEDSAIIEIHFQRFRQLLLERDDLKMFQIHYLERNWLLAKDAREVEIVQEDAAQRYRRFLREFPTLAGRLPQYHIASHLGITPTQLSRVRKNL
ncbi:MULTISPECIES: Crp/Fnr family transcriptional regulator [unclassified Microbulbifer]|uniref:Crp/Fnr family transcriptional regulator n=1 Tax=unclassified Microbulbifer TaxID=2619833 RepID=UPI0027E4C85E|nr:MULTISPECIES: Crp/Fnr family transcriptional regulator [unclassified Microbulbifer]